ncbi:hypothetical protein AWN76_008315 [Rhodothermaceae bacterium RA]|nr:hypothetical protein AWN76_008315 [Rhodothermaceae bacterium RA]
MSALPFAPTDALRHLARVDATLGRLIARVGPFTLVPRTDTGLFAYLLRAITGQQLSTKAAATIYGRVEALFEAAPEPAALLALPEEALRGAGLSRAKLVAARDLARKTLDGTVPTKADALTALSDDEIIATLTQVRGIGRWTVEMLLIFRLGHPDVLPATDLGIRKGFMRTYHVPDLPPPAVILEHGTRWQPYRTVASWYLWRALELPVDEPAVE